MGGIESLLECAFPDHFEREVVSAILAPGDHRDRKFWLNVHAQLVKSSSTTGFDSYPSVARCHFFCIAAASDYGAVWTDIVWEELLRRVDDRAHLDAFEMGAQLGFFQAGTWLQEKKQTLLCNGFLLKVAHYCTALFGKERLPLNVSSHDAALERAKQALDRAVKGYVRPQNRDLAEQMRPEIREMLATLAQNTLSAPPRGCGADRWLLDSLLRGSLDAIYSNRQQLAQAGLAIHS